MRNVFLTLGALATLGMVGAVSVVGFGLFNVSAQAGHWPGVSWVLHTTFRNSVKLRAPSMETAPDLSDPDLIALGAGHYATACAMCHGTPKDTRSATARAMSPEPPSITEAIKDWEANELHWIVENGVKMSGMPAWPVRERGDEVWSVVAWLVAVKAERAPAVPLDPQDDEAYCRTCHGPVAGPVPRLDILSADYIGDQLDAYHSGARPSGVMAQAVSMIRPEAFDTLAATLADAGAEGRAAPAPMDTTEGERLAKLGTQDVPACVACHASDRPDWKGPPLAGQSEAYMAGQLRLWRDEVLNHDALMSAATQELTDADIVALSAYFARQ